MTKKLAPYLAPGPDVLKKIVGYMSRVGRPVYIGFVSLEVRWSLERTEEMLQQLVDLGMVRLLDKEGLVRYRFPTRAIVYELTKAPGTEWQLDW